MQDIPRAKTKSYLGFIVALVIGAVIFLIFIIYQGLFPQGYLKSRELEQNQVKWENQHIIHYRMSLTIPYSSSNHDRMPLIVEVKDGKVFSVVDAQGKIVSPENDEHYVYDYPDKFTIQGLFSYVHQTYSERPPSISVTYNLIFGYPETIDVNPYVEPCCQSFRIEVRDFQVLPQ
jgi:hypothetical protein